MSFLPDNYSIPSSGGRYYKLANGENRLRILGSPILGYEYWVQEGDKKVPVRRRMGHQFSTDELEASVQANPPRHFWAMPVWSYRDNAVMVWEVVQKVILSAVKDLVADEDWNDPKEYDLVVTRTGEGMETQYAVKPKKHTPLSDEAKDAWKDVQKNGFDLNELFVNGDPFAPKNAVTIEDVG